MSSGVQDMAFSDWDDIRDSFKDFYAGVCSVSRRAWDVVRDNVGAIIESAGDIIDILLGPDVKTQETTGGSSECLDCDKREVDRICGCADVILARCGQEPLWGLRSRDADERMDLLRLMGAEMAACMDLPHVTVRFRDLAGVESHLSSVAEETIWLNSTLVSATPMSDDEAFVVLDGLCHEMYHLFQAHACMDRKRYGISKRVADQWKYDIDNYVRYVDNPPLNEQQSVEISARLQSERVMRRAINLGKEHV